MKTYEMSVRVIALLLATSLFITGCTSTTLIQSYPTGAKLYVNGEPVGTTPYVHKDKKIVGSVTEVRMELEGYNSLTASFSRDEEVDAGAIVGGVFLLFPFLWTMKYKPSHSYELVPKSKK